jgi:TetR/AcrR family fatty acid metabolism transcriptional regulator
LSWRNLVRDELRDLEPYAAARPDVPVKLATKILFGAMDQVATSWVLGKRRYRLCDTADAVADIFLKGVVR